MIDNGFITRYRTLPIAYYRSNPLCNGKADVMSETAIHTSLHNHEELEILCIKDGTANMSIDGVMYTLCEGDILIINPMEVHHGEYPTNQDKFSYFCIDFDTELIKTPESMEVLQKLKNGDIKFCNYIPCSHPKNKKIRELLLDIYSILCNRQNGWEYAVRGSIFIIMSVLTEGNLIISRPESTKSLKKTEFVQGVLEYIEGHYNEPITSKDLAEELSYNHCYLCRMFKLCFNKSFSDYLNIYRLCKAREQLECTDDTITQIAARTGFNCNSYFSQLFKKHIGVLPSEYRKNKKEI